MPRRVRILTAKRAFTAWAVAVYAFLYLPILVMVIFAFNKPAATSIASFHGSNICNIPPVQVGNITVWNGFTTCWFQRRPARPDLHPGHHYEPPDRRRCVGRLHHLGAGGSSGAGEDEAAPAGSFRRTGVPDPRRTGDRYCSRLADLLRAAAQPRLRRSSRHWVRGGPPSCSARLCSTRRWPCSSSGPGS